MTDVDMFLCAEDREVLAAIRARLAATDPLDESDHSQRHGIDFHLYWHGERHWHSWPASRQCPVGDLNPLAWWSERHGPLTFCDCPC